MCTWKIERNLVTGHRIRWTEKVFPYYSKYGKNRPIGERTIEGVIMRHSYGAGLGRHTFIIRVISASGTDAPVPEQEIRRRGKTLYGCHAERQVGSEEEEDRRYAAVLEKIAMKGR